MRKIIDLFKSAPILVTGVFVLVIAAVGSMPVGAQTLLPIDAAGRILLAVVGLGLVVVHVIRGDGFRLLTIDPRPMRPAAKVLRFDYKKLTVDGLLNKIYYSVTPRLPPHSYGNDWVLFKRDNGHVYDDIGTTWANSQGRKLDERPLEEVDISSGMRLEIVKPKENLWISPRPLYGPAAKERLRFAYDRLTTVNDLLDRIESSVTPRLPAHSYKQRWILRNAESGHYFDEIGPQDKRPPEEVGIIRGMTLEIVRPP